MTKIKICGVQKPEDARAAAEAGADFVGLVFVPKRRRRLEIDQAQAILKALNSTSNHLPQTVGLFADQPLEEVNRIMRRCDLNLAQLCGGESVEYCQRVQGRVIKVVHVGGSPVGAAAVNSLACRIESYSNAGHLVTLDRLVEGLQGGTGHSFDWDIAAELARRGHHFLLAGGLSPSNVAEAVAAVRPWGVDVSSGVETGGAKDGDKIRAFIRNAGQHLA